jgi:hypothetical protein
MAAILNAQRILNKPSFFENIFYFPEIQFKKKYPLNTLQSNCGIPTWMGSFNLPMYIIFMTSLVSVYLLQQRSVNKSNNNHNAFTSNQYHSFSQIILFGFVLFIFGNYSNTYSVTTLIGIIGGVALFKYIDQCPFALVQSAKVTSWPNKTKIFYSISAAILSLIFIMHLNFAHSGKILPFYLSLLICTVIWFVFGYYLDRKFGDIKFKRHHVLLASALFTRFRNPLSRLAAGVCLGGFIYDIALKNQKL